MSNELQVKYMYVYHTGCHIYHDSLKNKCPVNGAEKLLL